MNKYYKDKPATAINAIYTCPMHPEVENIEAGDCPICGMALELKSGMHTSESTSEYDVMLRRFIVCSLLSLPLLFLVMGEHLFRIPISKYIKPIYNIWLQFIFTTPIMLWGAYPFFQRGLKSLKTLNLNMFTLITMGTGVAYIYSIIATIKPSIFPESMQTQAGLVDVYFEAAAVIVTLVLLGQVMELKARLQTGSAIRKLLNLAPKTARLVSLDGIEKDILLEKVKIEDILRVRPGESIPVDGIIIDGQSSIDESMITGESIAAFKKMGDSITGGTLNQSSSFLMQAQHVGSETVLSQIVHMVTQAQRSKAPIQKMADIVSSYFVPVVIICAIVTAVIWGTLGPEPRLAYAIINSVAVLIIACPCALGLATPMSIMVGMGKGASVGILIKDAQSLEQLEKIDTLVIDKTGTLTEGKPKLTTINTTNNYEENEVLKIAASLEQGSEHPLAKAILDSAKNKLIVLAKLKDFKAIVGKGITGSINSKHVAFGNEKLMNDLQIDIDIFIKKAEALHKNSETVMYLSIEHRIAGLIGVSDPIKKTTLEAIHHLRAIKIKILMLTGDNKFTARAIANKLDINDFEASVLPDRKIAVVKQLQQQGHKVAMAGDGINDAPALAQSNVGIAMGTGADIAIECAKVTLVGGDLRSISRAIKLSRETMKNIRQNLFFAFAYNIVGVPIAAGLLYPFYGLLLSPIIASIAMTFSSVSVILNALKLRRLRLR